MTSPNLTIALYSRLDSFYVLLFSQEVHHGRERSGRLPVTGYKCLFTTHLLILVLSNRSPPSGPFSRGPFPLCVIVEKKRKEKKSWGPDLCYLIFTCIQSLPQAPYRILGWCDLHWEGVGVVQKLGLKHMYITLQFVLFNHHHNRTCTDIYC